MPRDERRAPDVRPALDEAEQEVPAPGPAEARDAMQDRWGNEAVIELLGVGTGSTREERGPGPQLGGEAPPVDPEAPLHPDDVAGRPFVEASRNRGGALPSASLPDEDWTGLPPRAAARPADPFEPPAIAVHATTAWAREAIGGDRAIDVAWRRVVSPPAPVLADRDGRGIALRARVLALAHLRLGSPRSARQARRLQLAALGPAVAARVTALERAGGPAPASDPLRATLARDRPVDRPRVAGDRPDPDLAALIAGWGAPLPPPPGASALSRAPEEDDPLGLDRVLREHLGTPDGLDVERRHAIDRAEALGRATARLRVFHGVSVGLIQRHLGLGEASGVTTRLDRTTEELLGLLLEIRAAARAGTVEPEGCARGLSRVLRGLWAAHREALDATSALVSNGLEPAAPPPGSVHPLDEAWADGDADRAIALARAEGAPVHWLTRVAAGEPPGSWVDDAPPGMDAEAVRILESAARLALDQPARALAIAEGPASSAIGAAALALTRLEAHRALGTDPRGLRRSAVAECLARGGGAAASLLARWGS